MLNISKYTCGRSPGKMEARANSEYAPMNCSNTNVEIKLSEFSNVQRSDGVLLARLPHKTLYSHICYPLDYDENKRAVLLAHVVCRQRGFMSYSSMYRQAIPSNKAKDMNSILPTSALCQGLEQTVSQCSWRTIEYETCRFVMGVQCGSCNSVIEAQSGVLHNPGFPYTYFYAVTCEWHIVVPEDHVISFTFEKMNFPLASKTSEKCDGTEPHVEILYGIHDGYMVRKYCRHNLIDNFTIPYGLARVRFFSGLYFEGLEDGTKKYGFSLAFQAIREELPVSRPLRIVGIAVGIAVFALIIMACYCCRKWEQRGRGQQQSTEQPPNAPSREEIAFPRCAMLPRREVEDANDNLPMQDATRMSISKSCRFHSRSTDVRHRDFIEFQQYPNYPEPRKPKDPSTTTPRCAFTLSFDNKDKKSRLFNFKTKLITRFTSSIAQRNSSVSIIQLLEPSFPIYRSTSSSIEEFSSVYELSIQTPRVQRGISSAEEKENQRIPALANIMVPTIVIDFYEDDVFTPK